MKKNIAIFEDLKFILACDGNSLEIIGTTPVADDLRKITADTNSDYNAIKKNNGAEFDPVEYLALSSMNFIPEYHEYSPAKLAELKKLI